MTGPIATRTFPSSGNGGGSADTPPEKTRTAAIAMAAVFHAPRPSRKTEERLVALLAMFYGRLNASVSVLERREARRNARARRDAYWCCRSWCASRGGRPAPS